MKKIFILFFIFLHCNTVFAQRKQTLEPYSQKFYKTDGKIYGLKTILPSKKLPNRLPNALLYCTGLQDKPECIFPPKDITRLGSYYLNTRWDINKEFYLNMSYWGSIEIGGERNHIDFFRVSKMEKWREISSITNESIMSKEMDKKEYGEKKNISQNLTGIRDFYIERTSHGSSYWHYDVILQKDETLLMPVAHNDSLYIYHFTDKAWTKPDYQGVEKNAENDEWTRISETKQDFKTSFRAFQIEKDLYFLANSDTTIYKYDDNQLKAIGKITPNPRQRTLFLIDKDDDKVYFLMCESIEIIPEERKRFALLTKEDELFKAVKRIIDEPDRK